MDYNVDLAPAHDCMSKKATINFNPMYQILEDFWKIFETSLAPDGKESVITL